MDYEAEGPAQISPQEDDAEQRQHLESVTEITGNARLSGHYLALARDLDVMEAKLPDEVRATSAGDHLQVLAPELVLSVDLLSMPLMRASHAKRALSI